MHTVTEGWRSIRATPLAVIPLTAEGFLCALLILFGVLPAEGAVAPAAAVFPLDVYFDVKRSIAFAPGWSWVVAIVGLGVVLRALVLSGSLWLADGRPGPLTRVWLRACGLAAVAALAFVPAAALFFSGVAIRYAPFVWLAALAGFVPAALLARVALGLDTGGGGGVGQAGSGPSPGIFLGYAYLVAVLGAAMSSLSSVGTWAVALLVACLGPVHALFLLGWRRRVSAGANLQGGRVAVGATVAMILALAAATVFDRYVVTPAPARRFEARGSLLLLGGADSSSRTGALSSLRPRALGFEAARTETLSYRRGEARYHAADTHADLDRVARTVSAQIAGAASPTTLFGHSQASLIVDRILEQDLPAPDRSIVVAPAPPIPPRVDVPPRRRGGPGEVGADLARGLAAGMDVIGLRPFDIDAPAAPTSLHRVVVRRARLPRLAIWALADSVWLDGDWRRPGERNIVVLSDHVGAVTSGRTYEAARAFLGGRLRGDDGASWRGVLVDGLRYAFDPWRP